MGLHDSVAPANAHNAVHQSSENEEKSNGEREMSADSNPNAAETEGDQNSGDPQVMLAAALERLGDNPAKNLVADALNLLLDK